MASSAGSEKPLAIFAPEEVWSKQDRQVYQTTAENGCFTAIIIKQIIINFRAHIVIDFITFAANYIIIDLMSAIAVIVPLIIKVLAG